MVRRHKEPPSFNALQHFQSLEIPSVSHSRRRECGAYAVSVNKEISDKLGVSKSKTRSIWLKQLGDNIRRERLAKAISQQRLAEIADLNIRNVQRIEAGELDVLLTTIVRIKKALDCPLERLVPKDF
jgi:DNA-binding Xre family transcriptional regulator